MSWIEFFIYWGFQTGVVVFTSAMRLPVLLFALFLCSCAVRKQGFSLGGGIGTSDFYPDTAEETVMSQAASPAGMASYSCGYTDSPKLSKARLRAKRKRLELGFYVDSVPPPALRNKADKQLARAQELLDRYERNQANSAVNMATYLIITVPAMVAVIASLESEMVGTSKYVLYQFMLLLLGMCAIGAWLIGGWLIAYMPKRKAARAYRKILNAPRKAPPERRIEYEVRVLLMLNRVMSPQEQVRRIREIREISQTDPYNPWLKRLQELKYYPVVQLSQKPAFNISRKVWLFVYLFIILLPFLLSLF